MPTLLLALGLVSLSGGFAIHQTGDPSLLTAEFKVGRSSIVGKNLQGGPLFETRTFPVEMPFGNVQVRYEQKMIVGHPLKPGLPEWKFSPSDGGTPTIVRADEKVLYVCSEIGTDWSKAIETIWLIDKLTGKKASSISLPPAKEPSTDQSAITVLSASSGIAVLTTTVDNHHYPRDRSSVSRLFFFSSKGDRLRWEKSWAEEPSWEEPSTLYKFRGDRQEITNRLAIFKDSILVCSSPKAPIRLLNASNGEERASLARLWEFRRGYIGPSVFSYYLNRTGKGFVDDPGVAPDPDVTGQILSGPIVVPVAGRDGGLLAYVGVYRSNAPDREFPVGSYFVYEVKIGDRELAPVSVTPMPRDLLPQPGWPDGDSVVYGCQKGAMVRMSPSESFTNNQMMGMGPFEKPDNVGRIEWFHDWSPFDTAAWLKCEPTPNLSVRVGNTAIRADGPAYVKRKGDSLIRFPFAAVDLRTGIRKRFELLAKLSKPVGAPTMNYASDGTNFTNVASGPLNLVALQFAGTEIHVGLQNNLKVLDVAFDAEKLLAGIKNLAD